MSLDTDIYEHPDDCDCRTCHLLAVKEGDIDPDHCSDCQEEAKRLEEITHE